MIGRRSHGYSLVRRRALLLLAMTPAACASPNPLLYVLAPAPGPVLDGAPHIIAVRGISLAQYLQRQQIVRSSEAYHLDVLYNDWWGEPLDTLINRVLVQDLAQRLPDSSVLSDNGAITTTPDTTVEINIERFDLAGSGSVLLLAQVAVRGRLRQSRALSISVPPANATTSALVAAMSAAVGQMADAVAALLAAR
jgi:uncharacterized lipoprotein YmbA